MRTLGNFVLIATSGLAVVILYLTLAKVPDGGPQGADKVYHAIAFGTLVLPAAVFRPVWLTVIAPFALFLGGAIELIQPIVGRDRDIHDFVADAVGIVLAILLAFAWRLYRRRSAPPLER